MVKFLSGVFLTNGNPFWVGMSCDGHMQQDNGAQPKQTTRHLHHLTCARLYSALFLIAYQRHLILSQKSTEIGFIPEKSLHSGAIQMLYPYSEPLFCLTCWVSSLPLHSHCELLPCAMPVWDSFLRMPADAPFLGLLLCIKSAQDELKGCMHPPPPNMLPCTQCDLVARHKMADCMLWKLIRLLWHQQMSDEIGFKCRHNERYKSRCHL